MVMSPGESREQFIARCRGAVAHYRASGGGFDAIPWIVSARRSGGIWYGPDPVDAVYVRLAGRKATPVTHVSHWNGAGFNMTPEGCALLGVAMG
jgi:hypothetical protein